MKIFSYLLIILLPQLILLVNFFYLFSNFATYQQLFENNSVYTQFESKENVDTAAKNILDYYKSKNNLDENFFTSQATAHLGDVKKTLNKTKAYFILVGLSTLTLTCFFLVKRKNKEVLNSLFTASALTIAFVILLSFGTFTAFNSLFASFHKIIFSNNLWLFPPDDTLIKLFPSGFFVGFANKLALNITVTSTTLLVASYLLKKKINVKT